MTHYISASAIKDYLSCSFRYSLRRYHKAESIETPAMLMGTIVHNVIENEWRDKDRALALADNKLKQTELYESLKTDTQMYVNNFFKFFTSILKEDDTVEFNFKIPLMEDVFLIGKIDRILNGDNVVIDWKTGKRLPSSEALTSDPQFILYNWAYKKLYKMSPLLYHASLYKGKLSRYNHDEEKEFVLFNEVLPTMLCDIREGKYMRSGILQYNSPCKNCTYKEYCWNELADRNTVT